MAAFRSQKEPRFPSLVLLAIAEIRYYRASRKIRWLVGLVQLVGWVQLQKKQLQEWAGSRNQLLWDRQLSLLLLKLHWRAPKFSKEKASGEWDLVWLILMYFHPKTCP